METKPGTTEGAVIEAASTVVICKFALVCEMVENMVQECLVPKLTIMKNILV